MTANTTDPIANFIGIIPTESTEVAIVPPQAVEIANTVITDIEYARENIYKALEAGHTTLEDLMQIAQQAQNAKVYEVLTSLIKTLVQSNLDLVELQIKKKQLVVPKSDENGKTTINNNVILTTRDLLQLLKGNREEDMKTINGETS